MLVKICDLISYIMITEEILIETFCEMTVEFYYFIVCYFQMMFFVYYSYIMISTSLKN